MRSFRSAVEGHRDLMDTARIRERVDYTMDRDKTVEIIQIVHCLSSIVVFLSNHSIPFLRVTSLASLAHILFMEGF